MSECVIILKFFFNAFAVSCSSFITDTIERLNAVQHFPCLSLSMRRLESNVCFLQVRHVKVSYNFAAGLMKVYLFQCSLHHCRLSSSTFQQERVFQPVKSCSRSSVSYRYSRKCMLAGCL